jgi:hypothetical protein
MSANVAAAASEAPCQLSVVDERTGARYELPIEDGAVRATDLGRIRVGPEDRGLLCYDPGLFNTATCKSRITYVDGERGILRYRGYAIEELAERSTFLEVAYLIVKGELPDRERLAMWTRNVTVHTMVHENIKELIDLARTVRRGRVREYDTPVHPLDAQTVRPRAAGVGDKHHIRDPRLFRVHATLGQTYCLIGVLRGIGEHPELGAAITKLEMALNTLAVQTGGLL